MGEIDILSEIGYEHFIFASFVVVVVVFFNHVFDDVGIMYCTPLLIMQSEI